MRSARSYFFRWQYIKTASHDLGEPNHEPRSRLRKPDHSLQRSPPWTTRQRGEQARVGHGSMGLRAGVESGTIRSGGSPIMAVRPREPVDDAPCALDPRLQTRPRGSGQDVWEIILPNGTPNRLPVPRDTTQEPHARGSYLFRMTYNQSIIFDLELASMESRGR